jgi:streptogramin lyase
VRGALVTIFSSDRLVSETVYSGDSGHYTFETNMNGKLTLRVRAPRYADEQYPIDVPAGNKTIEKSIVLRILTDDREIADSLPASAHFARIKLSAPGAKEQFQGRCLSCHEIGNPLTRRPRSKEEWKGALTIMTGYAWSRPHLDEYVNALSSAFDGTPTKNHERSDVDARVLPARIKEWKLVSAQIAHDTEFNSADGKFYTTDEANDNIYVTDPKSDKTISMPIPAKGVPIGGRFTERQLPVPFGFAVSHGVHSIVLGPDGLFYLTSAIESAIGVLDPRDGSYKSYPLGGTNLYPHTLRFDPKGFLWFTVYLSNRIGRFEPRTGKITIIDLPNVMADAQSDGPPPADGPPPGPYGIDVNPKDGSIWYAKLWANRIGRVDPESLRVQESDTPVLGPRRVRFDASGALWIPGFADGKIARLDTSTMRYKIYRIPTLAEDETEAPYALAVDPRTQNVWITANMSDRMFRLEPTSGRFTAYPLPTRGSYFRDIIFPGDGRVCASSSPMPPLPQTVEGGMDALVCLEPNGIH